MRVEDRATITAMDSFRCARQTRSAVEGWVWLAFALLVGLGGTATALADPPAPGPLETKYRVHRRSAYRIAPDASSRIVPAAAMGLSLTPVPLDFGNLYADNIMWAGIYTGVEFGLAGTFTWLAVSHRCDDAEECQRWNLREARSAVAVLASYVLVKLIAGLHARGVAVRANARSQRTNHATGRRGRVHQKRRRWAASSSDPL